MLQETLHITARNRFMRSAFLTQVGAWALAGACRCICVLLVLHRNTSNNSQVSRHAELFVVCLQEPTLGTAYLVGAVR
jgi:hypothetical protein